MISCSDPQFLICKHTREHDILWTINGNKSNEMRFSVSCVGRSKKKRWRYNSDTRLFPKYTRAFYYRWSGIRPNRREDRGLRVTITMHFECTIFMHWIVTEVCWGIIHIFAVFHFQMYYTLNRLNWYSTHLKGRRWGKKQQDKIIKEESSTNISIISLIDNLWF